MIALLYFWFGGFVFSLALTMNAEEGDDPEEFNLGWKLLIAALWPWSVYEEIMTLISNNKNL